MADDKKEKKFWKVFVDFESDSIDIADMRRVERGVMFDEDSPRADSLAWTIKLFFYTHPNEKTFKFYGEESRDLAWEDLKGRLSLKGVTFI